MLLTQNNIKSELSYAYLHAIASRAGCAVGNVDRHTDGTGVDAVVRARQQFHAESIFTHFSIDIQLKATSNAPPPDSKGRLPFELSLEHYNKLRLRERQAELILVVLYLPSDEAHWITHSVEGLTTRKCAFWVGLRGAPDSSNKSSQTIYIPAKNLFSVEGLLDILTRVSLGQLIEYEP